jgi:hypothetical protein
MILDVRTAESRWLLRAVPNNALMFDEYAILKLACNCLSCGFGDV